MDSLPGFVRGCGICGFCNLLWRFWRLLPLKRGLTGIPRQWEGSPSPPVEFYWYPDSSPSTEQSITIVRGLKDMTVMEPAPAWFECETSIPSVRPPKWLLGKTVLQAGANVGLEQDGTVHRLTLHKTCSTMTGPVHFTIGKSRSSAQLVVSGENTVWDKTEVGHSSEMGVAIV